MLGKMEEGRKYVKSSRGGEVKGIRARKIKMEQRESPEEA